MQHEERLAQTVCDNLDQKYSLKLVTYSFFKVFQVQFITCNCCPLYSHRFFSF